MSKQGTAGTRKHITLMIPQKNKIIRKIKYEKMETSITIIYGIK
jgi:hypothetical protein